jgi:transcriptional regulator with XRE-family HTH domain
MDVSSRIRQRLAELGLDQKDLANAAQVTESYISQVLTRRKAPPDPDRTDIYDKISAFLALPRSELTKLAKEQRLNEAKRKIGDTPGPLYEGVRALLVRKCSAETRQDVRRIFEKDAFGELERLVTQKVLEAAQRSVQSELQQEQGLRAMALVSGRSYEELRVAILEFLDSDIRQVSEESCVSFLEPTIDSWDIDLRTFSMKVVLNGRLLKAGTRRFEFAERSDESGDDLEPGFKEFLDDPRLNRDTTEDEREILKSLRFNGRRPTALYYYRELQSLRDPLHFSPSAPQPEKAQGDPAAPPRRGRRK